MPKAGALMSVYSESQAVRGHDLNAENALLAMA